MRPAEIIENVKNKLKNQLIFNIALSLLIAIGEMFTY